MATPKGYSSYRGRTPRWKIFVAVVLALVILLAAVFLLLQKHLVYDDSGIPHLELPDHKDGSASTEPSPDDLPEITIEKKKNLTISALQLGEDPENWQAEQEGMAAAGQNAVVVTVKTAGGKVAYRSQTAEAVSAAAVSSSTISSETLENFLAGELYSVARLSCFRDGIAGREHVEQMGLKNTGGYIFYDGNNENWIDPAKPAARQYLCDLAVECAQMGFDEIFLTDFGYPTEGKLDKISYGEQLKTENLRSFLEELAAALEPYEVKLSIELSAEDISARSNGAAGLMLAELSPRADRIWAVCDVGEIQTLTQTVQDACEDTDFVPELTKVPETEGSYLLLPA